jgi:AmmeMemoRadiSam system protein A
MVYLNNQSQKELLQIARKTLIEYVALGKVPDVIVQSKELKIALGAFVTLYNNDQLRGCIGTFEPDESLYKVVQDMVVSSSSKDPRFLPVEKDELDVVRIEISIMTPKKRVKDWKEIELGKHGVIIKKGYNAGTFLPQVAADTGWDLETFLGQLCERKAGLNWECYKDPETEIYIFECQIINE